MSFKELESTVQNLPWGLQEQILGYAKSVDGALPEIFRDAGRTFDRNLGDQVVFLAGLRKLHSIVTSSYWTLDNSGKLLESMQVSNIRAGALDLSRGGRFHKQLEALVKDIEKTFEKADAFQYLRIDFATIVKTLSQK